MPTPITTKELFSKKPEKTLTVGTVQLEIAKIPANKSVWGLYYDVENLSPETLESYLLEPDKALHMPLMMSLVQSKDEWIVPASETYKMPEEAPARLQLYLPFDDYKKYLDTLIFHPNQVMLTKLPKPYYKETERRVFIGFLYFPAMLEPYEEQ